jgi:hypothetical protein
MPWLPEWVRLYRLTGKPIAQQREMQRRNSGLNEAKKAAL